MNTSSPARPISVVVPFSQAIERVKQMLFRPFDLSRWLAIGFCAWLATLGEAWGGGGGGSGSANRSGSAVRSFNDGWDKATSYVSENLIWLVPLVIVGILLVFAVWLLVLWLSSRGQFMFLHNVATNRAEVVLPWNTYSQHSNSLFRFRILLTLLAFILILPFLAGGGWAVFLMIRKEEFGVAGVLIAIGAFIGAAMLGLAFGLVAKLTKDFVVPVMWLRSPQWRPAWSEITGLFSKYLGSLVLYLLFQLLLGIGILCVIIGLVLVTCCLAGCLLAIPYVGTVLLLPILVFVRAYSAFFLAQFGPRFDVFQPATSELGASGGTSLAPEGIV